MSISNFRASVFASFFIQELYQNNYVQDTDILHKLDRNYNSGINIGNNRINDLVDETYRSEKLNYALNKETDALEKEKEALKKETNALLEIQWEREKNKRIHADINRNFRQ